MTRVFPLEKLPPGMTRIEMVGDYTIAFFNIDDAIYAVDDVCPHLGGPLHDGTVEQDEKLVTCPLHGWRFSLCDGTMHPGRRRIATFDVEVRDGDVYVSDVPRPIVPLGD
jgi:nitrite reductase/ring-hydroxylating ferredoxin subunit